MLTANVDVSDGLVNGATQFLKKVKSTTLVCYYLNYKELK